MDLFSPQQYSQCRRLVPPRRMFTWLCPEFCNHESAKAGLVSAQQDSVKRAFTAIGLCNTSVFLGFQYIIVKAIWGFEQKFVQMRAMSPIQIPPEQRIRLGQAAIHEAIGPWLLKLAFSHDTRSFGPWWTLLTSSFVHTEIIHFTKNMALLWALRGPCAQIRSLHGFGVLSITAISTVCCNLAFRPNMRWLGLLPSGAGILGLGASDVVAAFVAVALSADPFARARIDLGILDISIPVWALALGTLGSDIAALYIWFDLPGTARLGVPPQYVPCHVGHLLGALIGATYYLLALRRAEPASKKQ